MTDHRKCCIQFCKNTAVNSNKHFFKFPSNEVKRNNWLELIGRKELHNLKSLYICDDHFLKTDLNFQRNRILGPYARPTNFTSIVLCSDVNLGDGDKIKSEVILNSPLLGRSKMKEKQFNRFRLKSIDLPSPTEEMKEDDIQNSIINDFLRFEPVTQIDIPEITSGLLIKTENILPDAKGAGDISCNIAIDNNWDTICKIKSDAHDQVTIISKNTENKSPFVKGDLESYSETGHSSTERECFIETEIGTESYEEIPISDVMNDPVFNANEDGFANVKDVSYVQVKTEANEEIPLSGEMNDANEDVFATIRNVPFVSVQKVIVQEIIDMHINKLSKEILFQVRWLDYSQKWDTWLSLEDLTCQRLITNYLEASGRQLEYENASAMLNSKQLMSARNLRKDVINCQLKENFFERISQASKS